MVLCLTLESGKYCGAVRGAYSCTRSPLPLARRGTQLAGQGLEINSPSIGPPVEDKKLAPRHDQDLPREMPSEDKARHARVLDQQRPPMTEHGALARTTVSVKTNFDFRLQLS